MAEVTWVMEVIWDMVVFASERLLKWKVSEMVTRMCTTLMMDQLKHVEVAMKMMMRMRRGHCLLKVNSWRR